MIGHSLALVWGVCCFRLQAVAAGDHQLYVQGEAVGSLAGVGREDVVAGTELDCGRKCAAARGPRCTAFHWDAPSRQCQHVVQNIHNYVQLDGTTNTAQYSFYYINQAMLTPTLPQRWLFCPVETDGVYTASVTTSTLNLTFTMTLGTFSHDDGWDACTAAGQTLMKISTRDKQAVMEDILTSCSDLSGHDYWLDGSMDNTTAWLYADGSAVPMTTGELWDQDAPNNVLSSGGRDCVRMRAAKGFRWDDYDCTAQKYAYICEPL